MSLHLLGQEGLEGISECSSLILILLTVKAKLAAGDGHNPRLKKIKKKKNTDCVNLQKGWTVPSDHTPVDMTCLNKSSSKSSTRLRKREVYNRKF